MSELLLSRTLDLADYGRLAEELAIVDRYTLVERVHCRWEYALALHAVGRWRARNRPLNDPLYDVGGAGSQFHFMLCQHADADTTVIDPHEPGSRDLADWMHGGIRLADVVTCVSVLQHVTDLPTFLYHLSCLVAPGGLLVLTMDYWNRCGADTTQSREQRKRLLCPKTYAQLRLEIGQYFLTPFGGVDPTYHGAHLDHEYTVASLVLEKRR